MGNVTIYPKGTADITVPAGQSIAISNFGGGIAQIYYLITAANAPPAFQFQQTLENSSVTLGAFSVETIVRIEANNSKVIYDVGVSPDTGIGDADTLNGLPSDTTDTADTIVARDSSGDIQANAFESTVTTGTPPLTVNSTTLVSKLNSDLLDGYHGDKNATINTAVIRTSTGAIQGVSLVTGVNGGGDSSVLFYDDNSDVFRYLKWSDSNNNWRVTDNSGIERTLWHAGNNPSVGAGNGISGSFTTTDGKTVTVTNGIITAIV